MLSWYTQFAYRLFLCPPPVPAVPVQPPSLVPSLHPLPPAFILPCKTPQKLGSLSLLPRPPHSFCRLQYGESLGTRLGEPAGCCLYLILWHDHSMLSGFLIGGDCGYTDDGGIDESSKHVLFSIFWVVIVVLCPNLSFQASAQTLPDSISPRLPR